MYSVFLSSGVLAFFYFDSDVFQELSVLAMLVPTVLLLWWGRIDFSSTLRIFFKSLVYVIPVGVSVVINLAGDQSDVTRDLIIYASIAFVFLVGSAVANCNYNNYIDSLFTTISVLMVPVLLYVLFTQNHAYVWGRWRPFGVHPNWWGMICLGIGWGALLLKRRVLQLSVLILSLYFMFLVQSRGSMVAIAPAILLSSRYFLPVTPKKILWSIVTLFVGVGGLCVFSILYSIDILDVLTNFVYSDVLRMDDPNRGIGTGMSGRVQGYAVAWEAFLDSPIWGVGYKSLGFVHNGFLLILAESGLFSLLGLLYLLGSSFLNFLRHKQYKYLGILLSYIVFMMTYPRSINLNLTSIMFLFVMCRGLALPQKPSA